MGSRTDRQSVDALLDAAVAGDLPTPNVRFVNPGVLGAGALGAYDARDGGTILLDRSLLSDKSALERVYTEEAGHHFDALLGTGDAAGDEGAIFAQSLLAGAPSFSELSTLRLENDHGSVTLDGRVIDVEFSLGSDTPGGSPEGIGGKESGIGGGSTHTNGNSESDRRGVTKPAKPTTPAAPE